MFTIVFEGAFKSDLKRIIKRGASPALMDVVLDYLETGQLLPAKHKNHRLSGNYSGFWECHVKPDWILIYWIDETKKIVYLSRTGTHSDLFK
jgi:mRNA interferase YafQ